MFLANENFPRPNTILLRENGFNVKSIQEEFSGITDDEVIKIASELNLITLTFDCNYGELIFKYAKDNPPAVVFFREEGSTPDFAGKALVSLLTKSELSFNNTFTVREQNNIRQRLYKK